MATPPEALQIPPIRTDLTEPAPSSSGQPNTAKEWYYYWRRTGAQVNSLWGMVTYGTHANRPAPGTVPDGAFYFETDRGALYEFRYGHWKYVAGIMFGTLNPDQRPTDLGTYDAGFDFRSTDSNTDYAPREFMWSQTQWIEITQVLYGTHANRPAANAQTPARTIYVETDRGNVIYQNQGNNWIYVAGRMWGTVAPTDQRPTDLGANDKDFTFCDSNNAPYQEFVWTGSAWSQVNFPQPTVYWTAGTPTGAIYYSGGPVGIGLNNPASGLEVSGANTGNNYYANGDPAAGAITLQDSGGGGGNGGLILFGAAEGLFAGIKAYLASGSGPAGDLIFMTRTTSGNLVERMRVGYGGNVGIGMDASYLLQLSSDSAAKPGTNTWTIASDIRMKRNVHRFQGDINVIRRLNPIAAEYNGKGGTPEGARVVSFDAAELREIVPQAVSSVRGKLHPDDAEETELLGVNTHEIFYHMLRAIQYLDREVQELRGHHSGIIEQMRQKLHL